jgi:hypothetical protein
MSPDLKAAGEAQNASGRARFAAALHRQRAARHNFTRYGAGVGIAIDFWQFGSKNCTRSGRNDGECDWGEPSKQNDIAQFPSGL